MVGQAQTGFAQLEQIAGTCQKLSRIHRLGQEVVRTSLQGAVAHLFFVVRGNHQQGDGISTLHSAKSGDEFQTVHVRHQIIDHYQIHAVRTRIVQCRRRVAKTDALRLR